MQENVFESIARPTHRALGHCMRRGMPVVALNMCGGVACNSNLFSKIEEVALMYNLPILRNPPSLCTDNAVMIAWMGWELINKGQDVDLLEMGDNVAPLT
jgi:tRNA A37 threonylcarbamoyltransferase TsaD